MSRYASQLQSYKAKENSDWAFYTQSADAQVKQRVAFSIRSHISVVKNLSESMKSLHMECLTGNNPSLDFPVDQLITECGTYGAAMLGVDASAKLRSHTSWQGWINQILAKCTTANSQSITRN